MGIVFTVLCEVDLSSGLHVFSSTIHSLLVRGDMLQEAAALVGDLCLG